MQKKNDSEATSSSFFSNKSEIKSSAIKKRVLNRFNKNECGQLKQDLFSYGLTSQQVDNFFLKEGCSILGFALGCTSDEPLKFLKDNISLPVLQEMLTQDNFSVLQSYLGGQKGLEKYAGWYDHETEKRQIEKFKILLGIDPKIISEFMTVVATDKNLLSDKITANYNNALEKFKTESLSSNQPALS